MESDQAISPGGVSRRGFLKGVGAGSVAGAVAAGPAADRASAAGQAALVGPEEVTITLNVNGQDRRVSVEPRTTLLDALRDRLDLTGSKKVCDRGTCGACTMLLDGRPIYSCTLLAVEAQGAKITTIEGLGTPERMNPVQAAFVKHDAQQCGFCTPGFVVATTALLQKTAQPSEEQLRLGLGGNLCRCGTYEGIKLAVVEAARHGKGGS